MELASANVLAFALDTWPMHTDESIIKALKTKAENLARDLAFRDVRIDSNEIIWKPNGMNPPYIDTDMGSYAFKCECTNLASGQHEQYGAWENCPAVYPEANADIPEGDCPTQKQSRILIYGSH